MIVLCVCQGVSRHNFTLNRARLLARCSVTLLLTAKLYSTCTAWFRRHRSLTLPTSETWSQCVWYMLKVTWSTKPMHRLRSRKKMREFRDRFVWLNNNVVVYSCTMSCIRVPQHVPTVWSYVILFTRFFHTICQG